MDQSTAIRRLTGWKWFEHEVKKTEKEGNDADESDGKRSPTATNHGLKQKISQERNEAVVEVKKLSEDRQV